MPKAGKYEFPFFDLDSTIEKLKKVHDTLRMDEMNRDVVANTLDMSMSGGGFAYLISSMEKYGLIKTGGGKLVITELGKLALYGDEIERRKAKSEAVLNVELFNELFSQYGRDITQDQIRAFLRQKGPVPVEKVQNLAENVDKIYKNVSNYIITAEKLEDPQGQIKQTPLEEQSMAGRRFETQTEDGKKEPLVRLQFGDTYLEVKKEGAAAALIFFGTQLGLKVTVEKTD